MLDNHADIELLEEEVLGIFAHMDVVPAVAAGTDILAHQLSKMVASMRVGF